MPCEPTYFLRTERLGFRLWSVEDYPLALSLWGNAQVARLIGGPFSEEQVRERLNKEIRSQQTHGIQYWPLFLLSNGALVGCCGLRPFKPEKEIFELGFHLLPGYWGKGLAVESARAVMAWAARWSKVQGLFAGHHPENVASGRVLSKLGFAYTHEELYAPTGRMHRCYFLPLAK